MPNSGEYLNGVLKAMWGCIKTSATAATSAFLGTFQNAYEDDNGTPSPVLNLTNNATNTTAAQIRPSHIAVLIQNDPNAFLSALASGLANPNTDASIKAQFAKALAPCLLSQHGNNSLRIAASDGLLFENDSDTTA